MIIQNYNKDCDISHNSLVPKPTNWSSNKLNSYQKICDMWAQIQNHGTRRNIRC